MSFPFQKFFSHFSHGDFAGHELREASCRVTLFVITRREARCSGHIDSHTYTRDTAVTYEAHEETYYKLPLHTLKPHLSSAGPGGCYINMRTLLPFLTIRFVIVYHPETAGERSAADNKSHKNNLRSMPRACAIGNHVPPAALKRRQVIKL